MANGMYSIERRALHQHNCHVTIISGTKLHEAPLHKISAQGIEFALDHELEPGTDICVEMYSPASKAFLLRGGQVVRAALQADGGWRTLAYFPQPLIDEDLLALLKA